MLRDTAAAHDFTYTALRYFNVAGADPRGRTGQSTKGATHLIKVASEAAHGKRAGMVMDLLRKLAVEQEACIVTVTHDEKIFDRFDRLVHLRDGRLADA